MCGTLVPLSLHEPTFFILTALVEPPLHGYGVMQTVRELPEGRLVLRAGMGGVGVLSLWWLCLAEGGVGCRAGNGGGDEAGADVEEAFFVPGYRVAGWVGACGLDLVTEHCLPRAWAVVSGSDNGAEFTSKRRQIFHVGIRGCHHQEVTSRVAVGEKVHDIGHGRVIAVLSVN
jgi:hypothetical protein